MAIGPKELNEAVIKGLPDTGPVVMVNLVRFHARARDGDGSGWDAYLRYSRLFMPLLKACGGTILWSGKAEGLAYGALDGPGWDYVVLVQYPSRAAFLETVTSPGLRPGERPPRKRRRRPRDHLDGRDLFEAEAGRISLGARASRPPKNSGRDARAPRPRSSPYPKLSACARRQVRA